MGTVRMRKICGTLLTALVLAAPAARADEREVGRKPARVLSSEDVLAATGKTIGEWGAAWWQWAFVTPGVLGDTTGQYGPQGDVGGPVFFAEGSGGGAVTLQYAAPAKQYILLPVTTYIWTLFPPCAEPQCAAKIVDSNFVARVKGVSAKVDGVPVEEIQEHVVRVNRRNPLIFLVDAGPIDSSGYGGILPAEQSGYWLMLAPLAPGTHKITFGATIPNLDGNTGDVLPGSTDQRTTLTLHVKN